MRSRYSFAICCLPMAIAAVAVGLIVSITPTREQRAIADLIKAGATVVVLDEPKGNTSFTIDLSYCTNNDELLDCVSEIENVQGVGLATAPIHEAGVKCLLRTKGLRWVNAMYARLSNEELRQLERDLKRNNPDLAVSYRESVPLNFDK